MLGFTDICDPAGMEAEAEQLTAAGAAGLKATDAW